jgi:hypothetical protein
MTRIAREQENYVSTQEPTPTRRVFLASGPAATVFAALSASVPMALAVPAAAGTPKDPVLLALAEHLKSLNAESAIPSHCMDDALIDAAADRSWETRRAVLNTKPTTLAGAIQLGWFSTSEVDDSDVHRALSSAFSFFVSQYGYGT